MIKNYKESAFTSVSDTLVKHSKGGNSVYVLLKMIAEVSEKYPELKNIFIHDMGSFLTHWFEIVNDSKKCSNKLRAKILTVEMMMKFSDFNNIALYCYDKLDKEENPHTGNVYSRDILSYLACVIKAIIQSKRREIGFDNNSKKYGETKSND